MSINRAVKVLMVVGLVSSMPAVYGGQTGIENVVKAANNLGSSVEERAAVNLEKIEAIAVHKQAKMTVKSKAAQAALEVLHKNKKTGETGWFTNKSPEWYDNAIAKQKEKIADIKCAMSLEASKSVKIIQNRSEKLDQVRSKNVQQAQRAKEMLENPQEWYTSLLNVAQNNWQNITLATIATYFVWTKRKAIIAWTKARMGYAHLNDDSEDVGSLASIQA